MLAYIYKWSCIDSPNLFYIGSTWNMVDRKYTHKDRSKTSEYKNYVICRENGGYDNFIFEVLEEYECNDKIERVKREQHWLDTLKPTMNSQRAYATEEQLKEQKKEKVKQYYQEHKEERKQWRLEHKEEIKDYDKQYYHKNKEKNKEKKKQWRLKNSEIIECECGGKYKKYNHLVHIKTNIHKNYINNILS